MSLRSQLALHASLAVAATGIAAAQPPVFAPTEEVDAERPEAWLMAHTALVTTPSGFGAHELAAGAFEVGFEVGSIPHLGREERTVGFNGTKEEHVNRSPALARLRGAVGLPAGFVVEAGWTPAVEIDGAEAELLSLALRRNLWANGSWRLAARLAVQRGQVRGDFTCTSADALAGPPGSPANPFGCEAASTDRLRYDERQLAVVVSRAFPAATLSATVAYHDLDLDFQVDALTFGIRDRTRLLASTDALSVALGATTAVTPRGSLAVEFATSPLEVRRNPDAGTNREWTTNLRLLWRQRLGSDAGRAP